ATLTRLFSFTPTASTAISTLSLHDALPISRWRVGPREEPITNRGCRPADGAVLPPVSFLTRREALVDVAFGVPKGRLKVHLEGRSEEHTSELQSRENLVCRLLLEKKKHIRT